MKKIKRWNGALGPSQFKAIIESFHKDSDRAAGILAGSFVEHYLGEFLKEALVRDKISCDLIDQPSAPLFSFYARARLSFAMGLIPRDFLTDLDIIREIRNHFAHHPLETSFDNPEVEHLCSLLSAAQPLKKSKQYKPRAAYLSAIRMLLMDMHLARAQRRGIRVVIQGSSNQALLPTRAVRSR